MVLVSLLVAALNAPKATVTRGNVRQLPGRYLLRRNISTQFRPIITREMGNIIDDLGHK